MLCEISETFFGNFFLTWAALNVIGFVMLMSSSSVLFYHYYWPSKVTFEKWQRKTNPEFPSVEKVRDEIVQMTKGMLTATLSPAASLWLATKPSSVPKMLHSQAYCGVSQDHGWSYLAGTFVFTWIASDFFEFYYHRLGHCHKFFWNHHKAHHKFFNPSPFAVIADEYVDQLVRSIPLLVFPLLMPVNMDMLFLQYAMFFYCYGCYLHWGYELDFLSAHNPVINTSYHHYLHHAKSMIYRPLHTGFMFKIWDEMFGSLYEGECKCAKCACDRGERTLERFRSIEIPDYGALLQPSTWLKSGVFSGNLARDKNVAIAADN